MKKVSIAITISLSLLYPFVSPSVFADRGQSKEGALAISKVGLNHKIFNPSKAQTVKLSFDINKKANVVVTIYDRLGQQVRCINKPNIEAGRHNIVWDGRKSNGKLALGKVFLYVIEATAGGREKTAYNPAEQTGGLVVEPHTYTFDNKTGRIEYVLPKTCMVRLRAGLKDGMLARTILDWEPRTAGRHIEKWDGKDTSGLMNLSNHPDLDLNLACYTLPSNTIIMTGKVIPFKSDNKSTNTKNKKRNELWATNDKCLHYQHDPRFCREPRFTVSFPTRKKVSSEGIPIVSGTTPIRVELDERDAWNLVNKRFEILLFIDGTFFFEMEEGTSPFTFNWDTRSLTKGVHIITVNLWSYDDHIGVITRKVIVGEK